MKKTSRLKDSIIKRGSEFSLLLCVLVCGSLANSWASPEVDRQFQLESIGFMKAWDNIDGLFAEYVDSAYKEYFAQQSRFILNDLSKADPILAKSKLSYKKVIQDREILGQIARATRTESIIRTQITKEGTKYLFTLDWLHSPQMELMGTVNFSLDDPRAGESFGGDVVSEPLRVHLSQLLAQVPFVGNVTGRDEKAVTVNIGHETRLKKGDTLIIGTLDEVKKHPILKTIVHWQIKPVGKVRVEQVDESMAFGSVIEEEPGIGIARFQKVIRIETPPAAAPLKPEQNSDLDEPPPQSDIPRLGWAGASLDLGSMSWQFSNAAATATNLGGGIALGGAGEAEVWLTKEWFADISFGYSFWSFSQKDSTTGTLSAASRVGGVGGSVFSNKLNIGYSYLVTGDFFGPKGWAKLGYKSNSYSLPTSTTELTGPISFSSIFLGVGGDVPIRGPWGALADFNFRVISFINQTWVGGTSSSSSDFELSLGAYYRYNPRLTIRGTFHIQATGAEFSNGSSLSQKTITFVPALLYYF